MSDKDYMNEICDQMAGNFLDLDGLSLQEEAWLKEQGFRQYTITIRDDEANAERYEIRCFLKAPNLPHLMDELNRVAVQEMAEALKAFKVEAWPSKTGSNKSKTGSAWAFIHNRLFGGKKPDPDLQESCETWIASGFDKKVKARLRKEYLDKPINRDDPSAPERFDKYMQRRNAARRGQKSMTQIRPSKTPARPVIL
jgi:hypothetical protein